MYEHVANGGPSDKKQIILITSYSFTYVPIINTNCTNWHPLYWVVFMPVDMIDITLSLRTIVYQQTPVCYPTTPSSENILLSFIRTCVLEIYGLFNIPCYYK